MAATGPLTPITTAGPLTVVILGRPNVGKSTLFNRLAGKRLALVDDTPGVTRDWRAAPAALGGLSFTVVDTAGLEEAFDDSLEARMRRQTERALARADVALLLIDARAGVTPLDQHFVAWLRRQPVPVVLVANKCEGRPGQGGLLESYELGLGEPVPISAEHGEGMGFLVEALLPYAAAAAARTAAPEEAADQNQDQDAGSASTFPEDAGDAVQGPARAVEDVGNAEPRAAEEIITDDTADAETLPEDADPVDDPPPRVLHLAIVGRPNVGKSTLLNGLIGEERVLTGPEAGMTRDAIAVEWVWRGQPMRLIDTAGLRRRARVSDKLEKLAVADGLREIRLAHVVVLVVDATTPAVLDKQDLTIARMVLDEGRALVVAVNKWDCVTDRKAVLTQVRERLEVSLPQARGVCCVTLSALHRQRLPAVLDSAVDAYTVWNRRIATSRLNRWLAGVTEHHPPPLVDGRRVKIRYMTQLKARPPTFALWVNKPVNLPDSYLRYLINGLRESCDLPGVPLRLLLRKGRNPYADDGGA